MTSLHRASRPSSARRPVPTRRERAFSVPLADTHGVFRPLAIAPPRRADPCAARAERADPAARTSVRGPVPPVRRPRAVLDPPHPRERAVPVVPTRAGGAVLPARGCSSRAGGSCGIEPGAGAASARSRSGAPGAPSGQITSTGRPGRDGRGPLARRTGPAAPRTGREARGRPAPHLPSVGGSDRRCGRVLRQQVLLVGLHARHTATGDVLQPGVDRPALLLATLVEELVERAPGAEPAAVDALRR